MLVCLVTVALKLEQPGNWPLACMGEQVALRAPVQRAESQMELNGKDFDFGDFWEVGFPDEDLEMPFDPAFDDGEDSDIAYDLGARNLHPDPWFEPFYENIPVHPYVASARPYGGPPMKTFTLEEIFRSLERVGQSRDAA